MYWDYATKRLLAFEGEEDDSFRWEDDGGGGGDDGGGSDSGDSGDGGGGDGGGGDGSGGGDDGGGSGDPGWDQEIAQAYEEVSGSGSTSRGERFEDQDADTQSMFQSVYGESAASNWARERESYYHESMGDSGAGGGGGTSGSVRQSDLSDALDVEREYRRTGRQPAPHVDENGRIFTPRIAGVTEPGVQPDTTAYQPPRPSTTDTGREMTPAIGGMLGNGPNDVGPTAPAPAPAPATPTAPEQPVVVKAASTAAKDAVAAGASEDEAAVTAASAATAAALALDKRSMLGESQATQDRFRQIFGSQADVRWKEEHDAELRLNKRLYNHPEPRAGTPSLDPKYGPAPDRTIGPKAQGVPNLLTPPGQRVGAAPAAAPAGAKPAAAPAAKPQTTATAASGAPAAAPPNPAMSALAVDLADVPAYDSSPVGSLVNANDPIEASVRVNMVQAVDDQGNVDPEFAKNAARAIANGDPEGQQMTTTIAQMAWYRERIRNGEKPLPPEEAPPDYIAAWKKVWNGGGTAPLTESTKAALHEYGFATPAEQGKAGVATEVKTAPRAPTARTPEITPEDADIIERGPATTAPAMERQGATERPDINAAPYTDAQGNLVPNPVAGRAQARGDGQAFEPIMRGNEQVSEISPSGETLLHWWDPVQKRVEALPYGTDPNAGAQEAESTAMPDAQMPVSQRLESMVAGTYEGPRLASSITGGPAGRDIRSDYGPRPAMHGPELIQGPQQSELAPRSAVEGGQKDTYAQEGAPLLSQAVRLSDKPLTAATGVLLGTQQGARTLLPQGGEGSAEMSVAHGIMAGEEWAKPALESIAKLAYAREARDRPDNAPQDYIDSWIESWKNGDNPYLSDRLDDQLWEKGIHVIPGAKEMNWQNTYGEDVSFNQAEFAKRGLLTYNEAMNACGPAALVSFLRASGNRLPTPEEGLRLGRAAGWAGGAFPGPYKMVEQMRNVGMDVSDVQQADFSVINQDVDNGKPVIFDTSKGANGHYFVVSGRNAQTGQYLVGGSGEALKNGSKWMTIGQMTNLMGAPNKMIRLNKGNYLRDIVDPSAREMAPTGPGQVTGGGGSASTATMSAASAPQQQGEYNVWKYDGPIVVNSATATNGVGAGEIEDFARRAAAVRGVDPDAVMALINDEGGTTNPVRQNMGGSQAFGPMQLMRGGVGTEFERYMRNQYGVDADVRHPRWWKAATEFGIEKGVRDGGWFDWEAMYPKTGKGDRRRLGVSGASKVVGISDEALRYAGVK